MGVVLKQSFLNSIISYVGIILGYVNVVLLFPHIMESEEFGLTRFLLSASLITSQFSMLGLQHTMIRFFSEFRDNSKGHNGILFWTFITAGVGLVICTILIFVFKEQMVDFYEKKSSLVTEYYYLLIPFTVFGVAFSLLDAYARSLFKTVAGLMLKTIFMRLLVTAILLLYMFQVFDYHTFILLFVLSQGVTAFALLVYLLIQKKIHFTLSTAFFTKERLKRIRSYSGFTYLSNVAAMIIGHIDILMISAYLGLSETALYAIAMYISRVIFVPADSISRIVYPLVAQAWSDDNHLSKLNSLYKKTSLNQLLVSGIIFIGLWVNIDSIFTFLPPEYASGKYVFLFIGLGQLFDATLGANRSIIVTSKYYRVDILFNAFLVIFVVGTNMLFIPRFGVEGAAIATASTIFVYNILKFSFIWWKYSMQPFTKRTILGIGILVIALLLNSLIPGFDNVILDILIRSGIIGGAFLILIYFTKTSLDINAVIDTVLQKFIRREP